jgi:predicted heme/steroid binding protein/uncharacterized membrane protein
MKRMDKDELKGNYGAEGRAAYVAYEGRVYDVTGSKLWREGRHLKTHQAGRDLTLAMKAAPHGPEILERFQQVAELAEEKVAAKPVDVFKMPPRLISLLLDRHPHPMSVHFPIALSITAAFFSFLSLFIKGSGLESVALFNMVLAALSAPLSIATGLLSWYYNYGRTWTHIYRMKALFSIVLIVLFAFSLAVKFVFLSGEVGSGFWYWIFTCLVIAMAPTVVILGYYGGKITFPS